VKFKPINGWTKEKILDVIRARPFEGQAFDREVDLCMYLTEYGNKCAVGLFIPDGHEGQTYEGGSRALFRNFPDLLKLMPLPVEAMASFQMVHDDAGEDAKERMLDWVEKNVSDDAEEVA
jgi:hypothetical protein